MFATGLGIAIGVGFAMQTAINSQLRKFVLSPFKASMISFIVGVLILTVVMLVSGSSLGIPHETFTNQPFWIWLGGLFGVIGLTTNILLFPRIGSVQAAVMPIFGMIVMGMLIDNFGWFNSIVQPFTTNRIVGVLLLLIGIFLTVVLTELVKKRRNIANEQDDSNSSLELWIWRIIGIGAGMLMSAQAAINGQLGSVLGSPVHAAFVSFFVGAAILIIVVIVKERSFKDVINPITKKAPWWVWLGGLFGATYVLVNVYLVSEIGTGPTVILALFGQLTGSLLVERFGLLGSHPGDINKIHVIGLLIMLVGVIMIQSF
ncbi:MAG TPA: DMT family transporter [Aliicoccus persicus]|uniref:DMT family transporter n=1 Tax=Aliicoccus persicus TaxID=930138 RepID=A0A921DYC5_9STAP|nr:DMT family transporter [Aliicoccus persicus]